MDRAEIKRDFKSRGDPYWVDMTEENPLAYRDHLIPYNVRFMESDISQGDLWIDVSNGEKWVCTQSVG